MEFKSLFKYKKLIIYLFLPAIILIFLMIQFLISSHRSFDTQKFDVNKVYSSIKELTSSKYDGRMPGAAGNQLALNYLENTFKNMGVEPGGDNNTYYQNFKSIVPVYNSRPVLNIIDSKGRTIKSYTYGKDFRDFIQGMGGSGEASGQISYIEKYIKTYSEKDIKNKILLADRELTDDEITYAMNNGAMGIIEIDESVNEKTGVDVKAKPGRTIIMDLVTPSVGQELKAYAGKKFSAEVKTDVTFKVVNTSNFLGKIPGKSADSGYLIIAAHIDNLGSDIKGGYFPGALEDASGVASLIELAGTMKQQHILPDKTIIFALWNNQVNGLSGSNYYVNNPIYPLSKTEVVSLDAIGGKGSAGILVNGSGSDADVIADDIAGYSSLIGKRVMMSSTSTTSDITAFSQNNVPAVLILDDFRKGDPRSFTNAMDIIPDEGTYDDNISNISIQQLKSDNEVLLQYIKHEVYGNNIPDFLSTSEKLEIVIYLAGILLFYFIHAVRKTGIGYYRFKKIIDNLYESRIFNFIKKLYYYGTLVMGIILFIICLNAIPSYFKISIGNGRISTNLSPYLFMESVVSGVQNFFVSLTTSGQHLTTMKQIIARSFAMDIKIISFALVISLALGMVKGISDGYRGKNKRSINGIGSIIALSIPDVLIIILALNLMSYSDNHNLLQPLLNMPGMREFIIPLLCLSIIPTVYISRLTTVAFQEEIQREYVKAAKARGLSDFYIIKNHILIAVMIKVIEAFSSLLTIIISNLIVLEYLYYYPGIAYSLFQAYDSHDISTFIWLALSLGLIYLVYNMIFKGVALLLNPRKKDVKYN